MIPAEPLLNLALLTGLSAISILIEWYRPLPARPGLLLQAALFAAALSGLFIPPVLPIILLYPLVTIVTGKILADQAALRASERNYRQLFEDHSAVKLLIDPDSGTILDANQAAATFYGWSRGELKGMALNQINTLPASEIREKLELARGNRRVHFEFKHRRADGSVRDVAVFSSITTISGRELLHSIIHDITEQKQGEAEQQKLRAKLLQARHMEVVGRLAGGVAHEFNNMMTVIIANAKMAMREAKENPGLHDGLTEISQAAERSAGLTRQLLAFARKQLISPRPLNLNEVIEGCRPLLQRLAGNRIKLRWHPGPKPWLIMFDSDQVEQLLVNLVGYAKDSIEEAGEIGISTANTTLRPPDCVQYPWLIPGQYLLLTVSDNGRGLERETLMKIFEPFVSAGGESPGPGLGLATAYGIVKQNFGYINVESTPGRGTAFAVYLPRHQEREA